MSKSKKSKQKKRIAVHIIDYCAECPYASGRYCWHPHWGDSGKKFKKDFNEYEDFPKWCRFEKVSTK